jgi:hypothetical protein
MTVRTDGKASSYHPLLAFALRSGIKKKKRKKKKKKKKKKGFCENPFLLLQRFAFAFCFFAFLAFWLFCFLGFLAILLSWLFGFSL